MSERSQANVELFYHYMMHRLYGFQFKYKPLPDEKERAFIPSGFDSLTIIKYGSEISMCVLCSEMSKDSGDAQLEDVFKEPEKQKESVKEESKCEDFGLILAQWKASSGRKIFHGAVGAKAPLPGAAKDNAAGAGTSSVVVPEESVNGSALAPSSASVVPQVPSPDTKRVPATAAAGKAALFWSTLKGKPAAASSTVVREAE